MTPLLKPFVDWAQSVLESADGGQYIPPSGSVSNFQTTIQPNYSEEENQLFVPGIFEPSDLGLKDLISTTVEVEMDASVIEASIFADGAVRVIRELEQFEHWITEPLKVSELAGMHIVLHEVLEKLASQNEHTPDVLTWENQDDVETVDKLLLATAYVLAWQPYGVAMQFTWSLAKPWFTRLSEVVTIQLDNMEMHHVHGSLQCLKDRVHHFDNLMYSYLEGNGSLEDNEDINADDDVDAVQMYHDKITVRKANGDIDESDD